MLSRTRQFIIFIFAQVPRTFETSKAGGRIWAPPMRGLRPNSCEFCILLPGRTSCALHQSTIFVWRKCLILRPSLANRISCRQSYTDLDKQFIGTAGIRYSKACCLLCHRAELLIFQFHCVSSTAMLGGVRDGHFRPHHLYQAEKRRPLSTMIDSLC